MVMMVASPAKLLQNLERNLTCTCWVVLPLKVCVDAQDTQDVGAPSSESPTLMMNGGEDEPLPWPLMDGTQEMMDESKKFRDLERGLRMRTAF